MAKRKSGEQTPSASAAKKVKRKSGEKALSSSTAKAEKKAKSSSADEEARFVGEPVPAAEAQAKWPDRYKYKAKGKDVDASSNESIVAKKFEPAKCHFTQAIVDGNLYNLYDDVYVQAEEGKPNYIAKIVEFFRGVDNDLYFSAKWFYRAEDTVIKIKSDLIDQKRIFFSDVRDDNPLDCIISKVKILQTPRNLNPAGTEDDLSDYDFYYDMDYSVPHCSFTTPDTDEDNFKAGSDASTVSDSSSKCTTEATNSSAAKLSSQVVESKQPEMTLLDIYAGCGAMSTGLCLGASIAKAKLVTRWALDINVHACNSLKINHPETQVRNEKAEDFLSLLKEWKKLCEKYHLLDSKHLEDVESDENKSDIDEEEVNKEDSNNGSKVAEEEEYEVRRLLAICFGDPNNTEKHGLYFKVSWKGYGPSYDTWEPADSLSNCTDAIRDFVKRGIAEKILPLPGDVDFICGGPPCQGMSGFNRFRKTVDPLDDTKNSQLIVFMNTVEFLKPRYVLMENVVDIIKLDRGVLGCYSIGRLVSMNYQARIGILAAGSFGACQCRMRFFLWGSQKTEKLPQYPFPTHDFREKGVVPVEFKEHNVAFENAQLTNLEKSVTLEEAISDLPPVTNYEDRDEMPYDRAPSSKFQRNIRLRKPSTSSSEKKLLYDHIPLRLNEDDYERVLLIPKKKGANFRDLPGLRIDENNKVELDPSVERPKVKSGKPMVPDYAISFNGGKSQEPFGRLWWDEVVLTVVTRAQPHNRTVLHPEQDRVLTVRENARLQGFPDWYRLSGSVKERYIQVGNAVAFPVSIALGYMFAKASRGETTKEPVTTIPITFPQCLSELSG